MSRRYHHSMEDFAADINVIASHGPLGPGPDHEEIEPAEPEIDTNNELLEQFEEVDEFNESVSEIEEGQAEIGELGASLEAAHNLLQHIKNNGMSMSSAMEARKIDPDFKIDLTRVTSKRSTSQQVVSVEGLGQSIINIAVRLYKAVKNALMQAIYWLLGKEYKAPSDSAAGVTSAKQAYQVLKADVIPVSLYEEVNDSILKRWSAVNTLSSTLSKHSFEYVLDKFSAELRSSYKFKDKTSGENRYLGVTEFFEATKIDDPRTLDYLTNSYPFAHVLDRVRNEVRNTITLLGNDLKYAEKYLKTMGDLHKEIIAESIVLNGGNGELFKKVESITADVENALHIDQVRQAVESWDQGESSLGHKAKYSISGKLFEEYTPLLNLLDKFGMEMSSIIIGLIHVTGENTIFEGLAKNGVDTPEAQDVANDLIKANNRIIQTSRQYIQAVILSERITRRIVGEVRNILTALERFVTYLKQNEYTGEDATPVKGYDAVLAALKPLREASSKAMR